MEGHLKKQGANIPIMHDRYCVATWAVGHNPHRKMLLRTYKNEKAYLGNPIRPLKEYELKCVADWDGRSGLKRHKHGFIMKMQDDKVFYCCAPSDEDKQRWLDVMTPVYYPGLPKPRRNSLHAISNVSQATTVRTKSDMDLYTFHSGRPRSESQNSFSTFAMSVGYAGSHMSRLSSSEEEEMDSLEDYEANRKLVAMDRAVKSIPADMKLTLDDLSAELPAQANSSNNEKRKERQTSSDAMQDPKIESPRESEIPNKTDEEPSLDKSRRLSSSYPLVYSKFLFTNPSLLPTFISESAEEV